MACRSPYASSKHEPGPPTPPTPTGAMRRNGPTGRRRVPAAMRKLSECWLAAISARAGCMEGWSYRAGPATRPAPSRSKSAYAVTCHSGDGLSSSERAWTSRAPQTAWRLSTCCCQGIQPKPPSRGWTGSRWGETPGGLCSLDPGAKPRLPRSTNFLVILESLSACSTGRPPQAAC